MFCCVYLRIFVLVFVFVVVMFVLDFGWEFLGGVVVMVIV